MARTVSKKRKSPVKKKKAVATKKVVKKVAKKIGKIKDPLTKSQLFATIAERTELSKKQVGDVYDTLCELINAHISKGAAGVFTLPGLAKIVTVKKPAKKARKGINPFTGEEMMFKAKPASLAVKVRALKNLKEMVN